MTQSEDGPGRDDQGDFQKEYPDSGFIEAVEEYNPATTSEVKEEVGCTHNQANNRLKKLRKQGKIDGKKTDRWIWYPAEPRDRRVVEAVENLEVATPKHISDELEMDEDVVEEVLYDLQDRGVIDSRKVPEKKIWYWYLTEE
jgi:predicted transcriptional regulator